MTRLKFPAVSSRKLLFGEKSTMESTEIAHSGRSSARERGENRRIKRLRRRAERSRDEHKHLYGLGGGK